MKKNKTIAVCALILALLVLCGGCAAVLQNLENPELRKNTETMLDALIADDLPTAYALVSQICTEEDFKPLFAQMRELLGDVDTYQLKLLSIHANSNIKNGEKTDTVSATYEMTAADSRLIINVRTDSRTGFNAFYLTPYEYTDYHHTGTLENMKGATGMQWILLLLNLVGIGFAVYAIVDCCRQKLPQKVLWILLLCLSFVSVGATLSATGFRLNFNVGWLMAYSAMIRYGSGTVVIRLLLPVGAIVYFSMRRSLLKEKTALEEAYPDQLTEQPPEDTSETV